jgi:hypothetical protein
MATFPVSRLFIKKSLQFLLAWLLHVDKRHLNSLTRVFQAVLAANCPFKVGLCLHKHGFQSIPAGDIAGIQVDIAIGLLV